MFLNQFYTQHLTTNRYNRILVKELCLFDHINWYIFINKITFPFIIFCIRSPFVICAADCGRTQRTTFQRRPRVVRTNYVWGEKKALNIC